MQNSEREREIERLRRQRNRGDALKVIADIIHAAQVLFRDAQCFGAGIEEVQMPHSRRDQHRPTAGAAANVQPNAAIGR